MLLDEFINIAEGEGIDTACSMLLYNMQYYEIRHDKEFFDLWKKETGEDLIVPESNKSKTGWYYEIFEDQKNLSCNGVKPIGYKAINTIEDLKDFLMNVWHLTKDDQVDQWGMHF